MYPSGQSRHKVQVCLILLPNSLGCFLPVLFALFVMHLHCWWIKKKKKHYEKLLSLHFGLLSNAKML